MVTKRIIPCLDVKDDKVVKGVRFRQHKIVGDILKMACYYVEQGADELVFYDIAASPEQRSVNSKWISEVAKILDIPFCVAGGIRSPQQAEKILHAGADKVSINSPALENPCLIDELVNEFGSQCVVVGIDSQLIQNDYYVFQYTGNENTSTNSQRKTRDWIHEIQARGAGEVVLNCMQSDGVKTGFDIKQIFYLEKEMSIPLIASGGAGKMEDFLDLFTRTQTSGGLAASVFHQQLILIDDLKSYLRKHDVEVRL